MINIIKPLGPPADCDERDTACRQMGSSKGSQP